MTCSIEPSGISVERPCSSEEVLVLISDLQNKGYEYVDELFVGAGATKK